MGRAKRWLKALFGWKKNKEITWGSGTDSGRVSSGWMKPLESVPDSEMEQSKRAIAIAAATAAAADAAVSAARAAAAVVRLANQGCGGREWWAAVKIQNAFRGFLVIN